MFVSCLYVVSKSGYQVQERNQVLDSHRLCTLSHSSLSGVTLAVKGLFTMPLFQFTDVLLASFGRPKLLSKDWLSRRCQRQANQHYIVVYCRTVARLFVDSRPPCDTHSHTIRRNLCLFNFV